MEQKENLDKAFMKCFKISKKFIEKYSEYELDKLIQNSHFFAQNVEDLRYLQGVSPNLTFGGIPAQTNDECLIKVVDIEIDFYADLCKGGFSNNERILYVTYLIVNKTQKSLKTISNCPIDTFASMIDLAYVNQKSFYIPSENDVWNTIDEVFDMIKAFRNKSIDSDKIWDMSTVADSVISLYGRMHELIKFGCHVNINNK